MKQNAVRTSLDIPTDLHRRLHEAAARKGCSARQLVLTALEQALNEPKPVRPKRRLDLSAPIIESRGAVFNLTNEEIYDLIEYP